MDISTATALAHAAYLYFAFGTVFASWFVWRGAARLDARAANGTRGFRLLIVPGAVMLWPWLLVRLLDPRSSR